METWKVKLSIFVALSVNVPISWQNASVFIRYKFTFPFFFFFWRGKAALTRGLYPGMK